MLPTRPIHTRYAATARRSWLTRRAALAALVVVPGVACGTSDAEVFQSATTVSADAVEATPAEAASPTAAAGSTIGEATTTTPPPDVDPTDASSTASGATDAATFPATAELSVAFTYAPTSTGGRTHNPYIAVWVEDLDGNLVQTISLWYEQSGKGARWLSDLPGWYAASDQAADVTMSGATRVAGDYTVVWDGRDLDGNLVGSGEYVLYVEAAREHGPHEITSARFTIGSDAFTVELPSEGELTDLSATLLT